MKKNAFSLFGLHTYLLFFVSILLLFSSCNRVILRNLVLKADNDNIFVTIRLEQDKADTSHTLKKLVKANISQVASIWDSKAINYNIFCADDSSLLVITSKLKGIKQAQLFFNAINNYKYYDKAQDYLKINIYNLSVEPDSVMLQVKYMPGILNGGKIRLEYTGHDAIFIPKINAKDVITTNYGDNVYEYRNTPGVIRDDGILHILEMKYPFYTDSARLNPMANMENVIQEISTSPDNAKKTYLFTESFWLFFFAVLGAIASVIGILDFYLKMRKK